MTLNVSDFRAERFRSLKRIAYPMSRLDVFVGANGVGKTNLYRALELLRSAAANTLAYDLVSDGGLDSALWAGELKRNEPKRIILSVGLTDPDRAHGRAYRYEVAIGHPAPTSAAFGAEAQIKTETVTLVTGSRSLRMVDRDGPSVMARDDHGRPTPIDIDLLASETVLGRLEDPSRYPELDAIRRTLLQWRFTMASEQTSHRRCVVPAPLSPRRPWRPTGPISPRCSPR